jgi:3-oxoadipate enol-lactonase
VIEAPTSTVVQVGDHETDVTVRGVGPPMLLIHAIGLDRRMWEEVAIALAAESTVFAYDLRGHGSSSHALPSESISRLADDAADVLESLGVDSVHVVGLSLGGAVAQELALRHPRLVGELTLCATLCKGQLVARERAERAEQEGILPEIDSTLERWFTREFLAARPPGVQYVRSQLAAMNVAAWAACWRALASVDTQSRLPTIAVPTRVVVGESDISTPVSTARTIAELIPNSTLEIVASAPHMLSLERPADLVSAIRGS